MSNLEDWDSVKSIEEEPEAYSTRQMIGGVPSFGFIIIILMILAGIV